MTDMLRWEPTLFEAQAGAFSSTKRYVRKAAAGGYAFAAGAHVTGLYWYDNVNTKGVCWACKIGAARDWTYSRAGPPAYAAATPTPVVEQVEI